jgi:hypothetical protein
MENFAEELESLRNRAIAFIKREVKNLKSPKRVMCGSSRLIAIFPEEQEVVYANSRGEATVSLKEFLEEDMRRITVERACIIADGLRG